MKKLLALSIVGSSILIGSNSAKADWDYWGYKDETETVNGHNDTYTNLYTINSATGVGTLRQRFCYDSSTVRAQECYENTGLPILQSRTDIVYPELSLFATYKDPTPTRVLVSLSQGRKCRQYKK